MNLYIQVQLDDFKIKTNMYKLEMMYMYMYAYLYYARMCELLILCQYWKMYNPTIMHSKLYPQRMVSMVTPTKVDVFFMNCS